MPPRSERKQTEEYMLSAGEIMLLSACGYIIERQLLEIECLMVVFPLFMATSLLLLSDHSDLPDARCGFVWGLEKNMEQVSGYWTRSNQPPHS
jgi:hypothetical protein